MVCVLTQGGLEYDLTFVRKFLAYAKVRIRPQVTSGQVKVRLGKSELSLAGPVLVSLSQLGPVVKVRPGQGQYHPGPGPASSRRAQSKPSRACLGQYLAGPVRSDPYQIWICPGKSQGHVIPGQVTARQNKKEFALANSDQPGQPGPRSGRTVRTGWS